MPIEIKELHIKITVDDSNNAGRGGASSGEDKQQLVAQCVEQVLDVLKSQKER
ncbi:DUF5908 family protein [Algoriphagus machipongonensis]|uniref:Uncharacterized protein n=1 Tax=Algoriphagus machipongonensis TaxID=388413 RepID=A3HTB9_9BACT|nr:DUF5908 family protein [Algoriphagus machipongonensis]EAZ83087.1 hypothetical protein ALPR1_12740 [Algoriphagus machipongonensis]7AEF_t Chain t, inner protein (Algo6) [Algoriphagus machipongonensis]7AEF_u Chain u, inner protein (Algo6) [Algoriphagus machipongonensis]7AEF_v Chain v, inner protein (Algo6) [Algoriphagus machipongonensis]